MGYERKPFTKRKEICYCRPFGRSTDKHVLGDAGDLSDLLRQFHFRVYKGVEGLTDLTVPNDARSYLDDPVIFRIKTRCFQVETDYLTVNRIIDR